MTISIILEIYGDMICHVSDHRHMQVPCFLTFKNVDHPFLIESKVAVVG